MSNSHAAMKLLTTVLLTAATAFSQSSDRLPVTDAEKIADALRSGPAFVTKEATVRDWPSTPGGEYRLLRKGSNEWTCLPAIPGYSHDEPGCFDPILSSTGASRRRAHSDRLSRLLLASDAEAAPVTARPRADAYGGTGEVSRNQND